MHYLFSIRLHNEQTQKGVKNGLFEEYTQKSCQFEIRYLKALEMMKCIPWYMPRRDSDAGIDYCLGDAAAQFKLVRIT